MGDAAALAVFTYGPHVVRSQGVYGVEPLVGIRFRMSYLAPGAAVPMEDKRIPIAGCPAHSPHIVRRHRINTQQLSPG